MKTFVATLPDNHHNKSTVNILIPIAIQGKECSVIRPGKAMTETSGPIWAIINVDGKEYVIPEWAVLTNNSPTVNSKP